MSEQLIQTPSVFGENGNYLLERQLGCGGMGGVYMGRDKMLDRPVAVKVMLKEYGADAEFVEKFKKEAQAAAKLIHPNIAQIYTYGISDGMPYIAMELVAGGSLWSIMKNNMGKTDVARVLKICQQVAQALLNVKAVGRFYILEVYAAECGGDILHGLDYFVGVLFGNFDVECVDVGKRLEQHCFPFHHWFCGQ